MWTTPTPAPIRTLMRTSPPAACRTASDDLRNAARSPAMPMPKLPWPASAKQTQIKDLRQAQGDRGIGERADQGRLWPAALPITGPGKGRCGMAPYCGHAQPGEAVPFQTSTVAGAGNGIGMRGSRMAMPARADSACLHAPAQRE